MKIFETNPAAIEEKSMAMIDELLGEKQLEPRERPLLKRIIHSTADFDFAQLLVVSPGAIDSALTAFSAKNCAVVTDTKMVAAGINRGLLEAAGAFTDCLVDREEVRREAEALGLTRSMVNIRHAVRSYPRGIYVIGNAPTALYELLRLIREGAADPALVVGVPVGFVEAAESKEELLQSKVPCIATRGRKGGSTVAVAVVNALLKML